MKKFRVKRMIDSLDRVKKVIEEYPTMNEKEFFEFCKNFIGKDKSKYNVVFNNENEIAVCIERINKDGTERWTLGRNPNNDVFEMMVVEQVVELWVVKECELCGNEWQIKPHYFSTEEKAQIFYTEHFLYHKENYPYHYIENPTKYNILVDNMWICGIYDGQIKK